MSEISTEFFSLSVRLLIVILKKEIKNVVTERVIRSSKPIIFSNNSLEILDYQDFDAKIKIHGFLIQSSKKEWGFQWRLWLVNSNLELLRKVSSNNAINQ